MNDRQSVSRLEALEPLDRRRFLQFGAGLAAMSSLALRPGNDAWAAPTFPSDPFSLGVASGDVTTRGAVLWTRLAPRPLQPDGGMPRIL